jgi:iron-sulfur cluster repair protein YtfE (RIC family)
MSDGKRRTALDMLQRSHDRLRERLAELRSAAAALTRGVDTRAAVAVTLEVLDHLERSVTRHEQDEEQSVFAHLPDNPQLGALRDQIEREHRRHESLHARLRELIWPWRGRDPQPAEAIALTGVCHELAAAYDRHMALEERELFPAIRALPLKTRMRIRDEMRERRGH